MTQQIVAVDIQQDIGHVHNLATCVEIVKLPETLKVPGHLLFVFGHQGIASIHIDPHRLEDGHKLLGVKPLASAVSVAKLVSCAQQGSSSELTFMLGGAHKQTLQDLKVTITPQAKELILYFHPTDIYNGPGAARIND